MLDQHDGGAELVVHVEDETAHVLLFLDVHAGHRLVEQQDLRLHGQGARQIDALLQAVGQAPDRRLTNILDFEEVDDLLDKQNELFQLLDDKQVHEIQKTKKRGVQLREAIWL